MTVVRKAVSVCLALTAVGCDRLDFESVFGGKVPPAPAHSATSSATASAAVSVRAHTLAVVVTGNADFSGLPLGTSSDAGLPNPLGDVRPLLDTAQVRILSLVSPLRSGKTGSLAKRGGEFNSGVADLLSRAGIDAVIVANDDLFTAGVGAFVETREHLERAGVAVAGVRAEMDRVEPVEVIVDGWSIALFAATAAWPRDPALARAAKERIVDAGDETLKAAIVRARAEHDLVFVAYHGNPKTAADTPSAEQRQFARTAIEAGADALFAHHAPVPLGVEWIAGKPVFHGLGTFVGPELPNQPWSARGYLARLSFSKEAPVEVDACPYVVKQNVPERLDGATRATQEGIFRRQLRRLVDRVGTARVGEPARHGCLRVLPPKQ